MFHLLTMVYLSPTPSEPNPTKPSRAHATSRFPRCPSEPASQPAKQLPTHPPIHVAQLPSDFRLSSSHRLTFSPFPDTLTPLHLLTISPHIFPPPTHPPVQPRVQHTELLPATDILKRAMSPSPHKCGQRMRTSGLTEVCVCAAQVCMTTFSPETNGDGATPRLPPPLNPSAIVERRECECPTALAPRSLGGVGNTCLRAASARII